MESFDNIYRRFYCAAERPRKIIPALPAAASSWGAAMSSKEFSRKTFEWLYQVIADPELPAACTKIAVRLTYHFNEEDGGRAFPGYKCIADAIGVSERTVERSVQQMHARGHLR